MPKFKFSKLVRDKIVDHQIASGAKPHYRQLSTKQHKQELINKIVEEAQEIRHAAPQEVASEIADVQQVLDNLRELYNLTAKDIAKAQKVKNEKNGAFKKGIFIDYIEISENDKWTKYYRKHPSRFPEIR